MGILEEERNHLDAEDHRQLWEKISLEEKAVSSSKVEEVVRKLDKIADNGGALLKRFKVNDEREVFEYVQDTHNANIFGFFNSNLSSFLTSKELNESIEDLGTEEGFTGDWKDRDEKDIRWPSECDYSPVFTDGFIAFLLIQGGAYSRPFKDHQSEAKELGRNFENEIIEDRYQKFLSWRIEDTQWADWFRGIPHWDETLILVDKEKKEIWLLMFTSTD